MPFQDILKKIEEASTKESAGILADAVEKSRKVREEAERQALLKKQEILAAARSEAERSDSLARTKGDALRRQILLHEKQVAIDAVFSGALEALLALPPEEYSEIMLGSVREHARGDETLILGPEDRERLGEGFRDSVDGALAERGKPGEIEVHYAGASLGGGYVLARGGVSQNVTFPSLVKMLRDELEIEVAGVLFGRGQDAGA